MLTLYGFLLTIPFVLNLLASRDDYRRFVDALNMSVVLASIWAFTSFAHALWQFPDAMRFHPLVDLIGLSVAVAAYMTQKQRWKLVLAFLFLAQLFTHVWFWWEIRDVSPFVIGRSYILTLNWIWFAQLVCVGWMGGAHVVATTLDDMRGSGRLRHLARH